MMLSLNFCQPMSPGGRGNCRRYRHQDWDKEGRGENCNKLPSAILEIEGGKSYEAFAIFITTTSQVAANDVVITITGKREGIKQATFIMSKIVKSNLHKLNTNSMSLSYKDVKTAKPKKAGVTVE